MFRSFDVVKHSRAYITIMQTRPTACVIPAKGIPLLLWKRFNRILQKNSPNFIASAWYLSGRTFFQLLFDTCSLIVQRNSYHLYAGCFPELSIDKEQQLRIKQSQS